MDNLYTLAYKVRSILEEPGRWNDAQKTPCGSRGRMRASRSRDSQPAFLIRPVRTAPTRGAKVIEPIRR